MADQLHRPLSSSAGPSRRAEGAAPAAAGMGMSAMRDLIKGSGGDASSAFEIGTLGAPITMPFQGLMESAFGMDLGGVEVFQGPATDAALTMLDAGAAEHDGAMLLPSVGVTPELVAHETTHHVQGEQNGHSGVHASGHASRTSAASEVEAHALGARAARGEPVSVQEPLSAGVNLWGPGGVGSRIVDAGLGWISDTASSAWEGTTDAVSDAGSWVADTAVEGWQGTTEALGTAGSWAVDAAGEAWEGASNTVSDATDWLGNTASDVLSGDVDADWLSNRADDVWSGLSDTVSGATGWLGDKGGEAWDGVTGAADDTLGWLGNKAGEAWDGASNAVDRVGDWASERAETGWHDMTAWHYEEREALNGPHAQPGTLRDGRDGWKLLPAWMSKLHDNGEGEAEEKWVNEDGREAVFDGGRNGTVMTDPRYVATYNYVVPRDKDGLSSPGDYLDFAERTAGHTVWDVLPWIALGNTRDDPTSVTDRIGMLLK